MRFAKFGARIGTLLVSLLAVVAALPGAHALADAPTFQTTHTVFTRVAPFFSV